MNGLRFKPPGQSDRILICGMTGTGKTRAAIHWLSLQDLTTARWVMMDFKGDDTLAKVPISERLDMDDAIPDDPGLYYVLADNDDKAELSQWFMQVYEKGNTGILVDEALDTGYPNKGLNRCLYKGRSRGVGMILCTQRPVGLEVNAKSQATYFQVLELNYEEDRKSMQMLLPRDKIDLDKALPEYHSYWYDVPRRYHDTLGPMPAEEESIERIFNKLPQRQPTYANPDVVETKLRRKGRVKL